MTAGDFTERVTALLAAATPGPWEADDTEIYGGPVHEWVAESLDVDEPQRGAANAALIAAAPALLAEAVTLLADAAEEAEALGSLTPCEPCPLGVHPLWFVDAEETTGCPGCLLADARARIETVKKFAKQLASPVTAATVPAQDVADVLAALTSDTEPKGDAG